MAACTTTYFEPGHSWSARVAQRNAELMAKQALRRRGVRTPEISFARHFDNSRLVKAADPVRVRQMRTFAAAVTLLFSLVMVYGLQHFSAIEGSYTVESEKQVRDQLREENRQLRLGEAELEQPGRIDALARKMGFTAPQPGQVVHPNAAMPADASAPALAQNALPASPAR
jgi:cell division protein FtsL